MSTRVRQFRAAALLAMLFIAANANGQETNAGTDAVDPDEVSVENENKSEVEEGIEDANEADGTVVEKEPEPKAEPEQPQINPDASFTPTEEISEDRPVPFPVDI